MKFDRQNLPYFLIVLVVGVVLGIGGLTLRTRTQPASIKILPPEPTITPEPTATPGPIAVFVNGAVLREGVYNLSPDSRVEQAIEEAGGFTAVANTTVVNLAQPLTDGAQVYVPSQDEASEPAFVVSSPVVSNLTGNADDSNVGGLVNINTATIEELESLTGIGPSTAQKIADFRDENGPFAAIEEIMEVPGIGDGKFEKLKDQITIE